MIIEVDVKPFATFGASLGDGDLDQPSPDPPSTARGHCDGVEDESVCTSVPGNVDEADELVAPAGADPAEAVLGDLPPPVVFEDAVVEGLGVQGVDLRVAEVPAPFVGDGHGGRPYGTSKTGA